MNARVRLCIVIVLCLSALALTVTAQRGVGRGGRGGAGQPGQIGPRGGGGPRGGEAGGFTLSGVVIDSARRQPLQAAVVSLSGGRIGEPRQTIADEQGRFTFSGLPFGRVTVRAEKAGYLTTYFGSLRPGLGPGRPVGLRPASPRAEVSIEMPKGAVIAGTIRDASGKPAPNVRLVLLEYRTRAGERVLETISTNSAPVTDDRGMYRVWGLLPGEYLVGAAPSLQRQARQVTSDEVAWAESQLRAARPGVPPSAAVPAGRPAPAPPSDPVRVFYPGTADVAGASVITLQTGEERGGVDFPMASLSSAVIRGTVTGFDPARQFPFLTLSQVGVPLAMTRDSITWRNNNGVTEFATRGLPPGRYRIMARLNAAASPATPSEPRNLWAMADVTLDAAGVDGVSLALRPGLVVSGRVAFDGAAPAPDPTTLRVTFTPMASPDSPQSAPQPVVIAPDGTFSIGGVVPGRYRFTAPMAAGGRRGAAADPSTWVLKSVVYGRQDVLDLPVEVTPTGELTGIVMTWFDRAGIVDGHVSDATGQPVTDDTVILFPVDSRYWGLLPSRRTLRMLPGPAGRFQFAGVLPGDYYLALTTDLSPTDLTDSSVFAALAQGAIRLSVAAGATTSQEIRIAGQ